MKFYCIIRSLGDISNTKTFNLLKESCERLNVEFTVLESEKLDYVDGVKELAKDSIVYRLATGKTAQRLELMLSGKMVSLSNDLIYTDFAPNELIFVQNNLPVIPSVFNVNKKNPWLKKYTSDLGGFPVVIKILGRSHGQGVFLANSTDELLEIINQFEINDEVVMKKFIKNARHFRLVVLGNQVISAIEYLPQPDDFRTNAVSEPNVVPATPSVEMNNIAIRAAQSVKVEFGGVDLLQDEDGKIFLAEINYPCNFARNQNVTGENISDQIVEYLIEKAKRYGKN